MNRHLVVTLFAAAWLLLAGSVAAAPPALPGDIIADLERMQRELQQGEHDRVGERARAQAGRLEGGNAADRWASALYRQLAAGAEARAGRREVAADHLAQARRVQEAPSSQRDRWLKEEAGLRLAAGQREAAVALLLEWHERHAGGADDRWRLGRALAELERWQEAARWVDRALAVDDAPDAGRQALAAAVYQRVDRGGDALARLEAGLDAASDPQAWRRAAALAQRLGDPERATALWEAGWRLGVLAGEADLRQRIELHLVAGTPARAAEYLQAALEEQALDDSLEHRRLLARAWQAARDRDRALAAWEAMARRSQAAEDWLRLGQLAHGWGRDEVAESALETAKALGAEQAERWLAALRSVEKEPNVWHQNLTPVP
ncbi:hypothetical protein HOP52_08930 [Halomonas campisalis]|uniref:Tetratricopeptide repeat protein n=1 Tax=Billgrantia campisalis TaxID=74661 RepID=A0ABS9P7X2_9GAMM|nr:hypothetical protein [Halomonas campisalis]MCG6657878.1 hypothetical protein [Halomonas campisalis]MDR5863598.1 hypothetical protein [Halomonas campisalis]